MNDRGRHLDSYANHSSGTRGIERDQAGLTDEMSLLVGGVSAAISKTAAAPIERVKLLIQNQVSSVPARRRKIGTQFSRLIGGIFGD